MNFKRSIAVLLALLLVTATLFSCKGKGEENPPVATKPPVSPEVYPPEPEVETDYEALLDAVFQGVPETAPTDLTYTISDGAVTVTGYVGSGVKLSIPATIAGSPVTAIADGAFADSALEVVLLPDSLLSLGEGILEGCASLYALHTPLLGANAESEQYLGYLFGADRYEDNPRDVPTELDFLSLGGAMTVLPSFSLYDCNDLVAVRLPESVRTLATYSMYRCASLKHLNTEGLVAVEERALASCTSLTQLSFSESLDRLGLGALEGCAALQSLTLPFVGGSREENRYLGYIFGATVPDFAKGYYPGGLIELRLLSTCTSLANYALYECESLVYLELPTGLSSIGVRALDGCIRLRSLTLPVTLQRIGENAFFDCYRLRTLLFEAPAQSALTYVGVNAFYGCRSLTEVILPHGLSSLSASAFADCDSLRFVHLGGVREVGKNAFRGCASLERLDSIYPVTFAEGNECATGEKNT